MLVRHRYYGSQLLTIKAASAGWITENFTWGESP
jgi:hypothetical protein